MIGCVFQAPNLVNTNRTLPAAGKVENPVGFS